MDSLSPLQRWDHPVLIKHRKMLAAATGDPLETMKELLMAGKKKSKSGSLKAPKQGAKKVKMKKGKYI